MPETLTQKVCLECRKPIQVAATWPHPKSAEATGIIAERWDDDRSEFYSVGWICLDCAWRLANEKGGKAFIGGGGDGGVGEWEFCY